MYTTFKWHLSVLKQYNMVSGVVYIKIMVYQNLHVHHLRDDTYQF